MLLLLNNLSRFVIAFLPRSKHLYMAAVTVHSDFGAQENRVTVSIISPSANEMIGPDAMILLF